MPQLEDIYPDVLRDHYEQPRNCSVLDEPTAVGTASNPLCGDELSVYLKAEDEAVKRVTFQGHLCAVATASASMMSEAVKERTFDEVAAMRESFTAMMRGREDTSMGELDALRSVRRYRVRVKCALLPWEALLEACNAA